MARPNTIKSSFDLPVSEKEDLDRLADANSMYATDVLRQTIKLLRTLGARGVHGEIEVIMPQAGEDEIDAATLVLPFDLSVFSGEELPTDE